MAQVAVPDDQGAVRLDHLERVCTGALNGHVDETASERACVPGVGFLPNGWTPSCPKAGRGQTKAGDWQGERGEEGGGEKGAGEPELDIRDVVAGYGVLLSCDLEVPSWRLRAWASSADHHEARVVGQGKPG